jgi:two-component system response regulator HydG
MSTILIVDDEHSICRTLSIYLRGQGFTVLEAGNLREARTLLKDNGVDLALVDLRLGDDNGLDLLVEERATGGVECIFLTAFSSIESAVEAMRLGAYDYLTKPVNLEELRYRIEKVLEARSLRKEVLDLRGRLFASASLKNIVAESSAMQQILLVVDRIRDRDISVLIGGETGVGKDVLARLLHSTSLRGSRPFLAINCATLPDDLLDSELFGHVKGAFTGASTNRLGLFQQADGGTLFLDEIGAIGAKLQAKFLRVLENGEVRPVGSDRVSRVDVRVLAATNRDLGVMVQEGEFRQDLFYRLQVLPIRIPPLRERREDILPLVEFFLVKLREKIGNPALDFTPAARKKLALFNWPGNVRQLQNVIERSFALHRGPTLDATAVTLAEPIPSDDPGLLIATPLADVEVWHIRRVLVACEGNQVMAARILGISRSTLRRKLSKIGSPEEDPDSGRQCD